MAETQKSVHRLFNDANPPTLPDSSDSSSNFLSHAADIVDGILLGKKPYLDPSRKHDARLIALFQNMEREELIAENWEQFVLSPGQDPLGKMANGVTSVSVLTEQMSKNGRHWQKYLNDEGINNCDRLGNNLAFRVGTSAVKRADVAQSFVLPEGDFNAFSEFLELVRYNSDNPQAMRPIAVDNKQNFWTPLYQTMPAEAWASLGVFFAESDDQVKDFITSNVDEKSLELAPLDLSHPFQFNQSNPVLILGTGNAKKIADFKAVMRQKAPLIETRDFQSLLGPFKEAEEKSITCVGNALEKMNAMLDEIYGESGGYELLTKRFGSKPVVLIANDTGARIQFADDDGSIIPVDYLNRPELAKSREFIAEGKERYWPGPEVKLVASAEGKSTVFYTEKLPQMVAAISREQGRPVHIEYTDDSVYLYGVLGPTRADVKLFATKGVHKDDMIFTVGPDAGEVDFENFTVPKINNPEGKARANLGEDAVLGNSSTYAGIATFLDEVAFSEPTKLAQSFNKEKGNVYPIGKPYTVGTLSAFDRETRSFGFNDYKRTLDKELFRAQGRKFNPTDMEGFESFLSSVDAVALGGKEGISLSPITRAALICRIIVAIQTSHPSFAGKPLVFVKEKMDPVCDWVLKTQEFLYNHKLFGRRSQDSYIQADNLKAGLKEIRRAMSNYHPPITYNSIASIDGDDDFDRPTVAILGSASTYDPQHIDMAKKFTIGVADRDLHLRHGGCAHGVVGGSADAFAHRRDETGLGRMTGVQCHGLVRLEGMNKGNDCAKIHETIGERKRDIFRSDILAFGCGGWGTYEELFELLASVEAGQVKPDTIIIMDYEFDAIASETTYMPVREFLDQFLTPEQVQKMNIRFVKNEQEALDLVDERLPILRQKYAKDGPATAPELKLA